LVPVIVVICDVAVVVVLDLARRVSERVPDRHALAVLIPGTFDLIRGRGDAPEETIGERAVSRHDAPPNSRLAGARPPALLAPMRAHNARYGARRRLLEHRGTAQPVGHPAQRFTFGEIAGKARVVTAAPSPHPLTA